MASGEHTHYEKYITRIVKRGKNEWLQFICEVDGIVFREVKIVNEAVNG